MALRRTAVGLALVAVQFGTAALAQPEDRGRNVRARVFDRLFPLSVEPKDWFSKMILRYSDSNTQLVVVVYPGGKAELVRYHISAPSGDLLPGFIGKAAAAASDAEFENIVAGAQVITTRSPINPEALDRALKTLKAIRVSPIPESLLCVDDCSQYEFWYDTGQESVHYVLFGPPGKGPQDALARWMIEFRAKASRLIASPTADSP